MAIVLTAPVRSTNSPYARSSGSLAEMTATADRAPRSNGRMSVMMKRMGAAAFAATTPGHRRVDERSNYRATWYSGIA